MTGALSGVRIVDRRAAIPGPWAAQRMADMGAELIKIAPPEGGRPRQTGPQRNPEAAPIYRRANRSKSSAVPDLKTAGGRAALDRLIAGADAVLHDLRRVSELGQDMAPLSRAHDYSADEIHNLDADGAIGLPRKEGRKWINC